MRNLSCLSLSLCTAIAAVAVQAQNAPAPAAEQVVKLDPVVVEGRLLTESPATVTTVDLAAEPLTFATTTGLAARTANFFIATNDAHSFNDTFALRGLINTPIFGDPAISFYLDDLPLGSGFTFPVNLGGFNHAELHRGPTQNTVFGRAGSAGVVTLATPAVTGTPWGEVRAGLGEHGSRQFQFAAATDNTRGTDAYVAAGYMARDGYITNTTLGRDIDDKDSRSALVRLRNRPDEHSEYTLLLTALRARDGVQPLVPLGGPLFTVDRATEGLTSVDAWNAAFSAAFATPVGRLKATTGYNNWDLGPYSSTLGFGFADLINNVTQQQRTWSEEVKLSSEEKAPVRWQVGAFYSDTRTDGSFQRLFGPYTFEESAYRIANRNFAAYGEATWKLAPALRLTAGLRAESSRKRFHRDEAVPTSQTFDLTRNASALLPKLGLSYAANSQTSLFATVGAGFKPGGFSAFTGNAALAAFGPERTKTFEGGVTHSTADKKLAATLRMFYYDIDGYQIERSFATSSFADDYLVLNAPRARSLGGEIELSWKPCTGLTLAADFGVTNVTLREFTDPYTGDNFAGNRAPAVPEYDASLRADYAHRSGFFVGIELSAVGETFYTEAEDGFFGQKAYSLLNARIGYAQGQYRVTVFGQNLTDKEYYSAITPGTYHGTPGAPRTVGVEFAAKF